MATPPKPLTLAPMLRPARSASPMWVLELSPGRYAGSKGEVYERLSAARLIGTEQEAERFKGDWQRNGRAWPRAKVKTFREALDDMEVER